MTIATKIYTALFGTLVGQDQLGNRYYEGKRTDYLGREKRWVQYSGSPEASNVPPQWHGWLHYTFDDVLDDEYNWQIPHHGNQTGSNQAYFPPGHLIKGGKRRKATGDYEAWDPNRSR